MAEIISPHGGYRDLMSYQGATIIYDLTTDFCNKYIDKYSRTTDQMVQAARSGKQNIAEGSMASGTSKKTELKLVSVARASLEELLADYEDYLRQHCYNQWKKDDPRAAEIRRLAYKSDKSYKTYEPYMTSGELAANVLICLIHQTNYLLDRQMQSLEKSFLEEGGFTEKLYKARKERQ